MGGQIRDEAPEGEGVQPLDRRGSSRTVTLFRPGSIETSKFRSFCLIRNISPSGLMAATHAPLLRGEPATVRFSETGQVEGKVVWQRDDRTGIEFSEEVDVSSLLFRISQNVED